MKSKRIFVISDLMGSSHAGGAAKAARLLVDVLQDMGHRVTAFAPGGVRPASRPLAPGVDVVASPVNHGWRWGLPTRLLARRAVQSIKREKPDHVFVLGMTALTTFLLKSHVGDQLLVWETTNATPGNKFVHPGAIARLGRCRAVLSPSATIDSNVREHYAYRGKILRMPFWVEDRPPAQTPANGTANFLYLGRKDPEKGLNELLHALALVLPDHPEARLIVCGPGDSAPFQISADRYGCRDAVTFEFLEDEGEVPGLIRACQWGVLPSYHEGYPLSLLESCREERPIIATAVGSIPLVFGKSPAAIVVPARDALALAHALKTALDMSHEEYTRRSHAAVELFRERSGQRAVRAHLHAILTETS